MPIQVPCGQCIGCRLEKSRQWAIRCVHEAQMNEENIFITLTYNNENLPKDKSLNKRHLQLFMKRLRKHTGPGVRFYACGEYGEKFKRPHYHACIFNYKFKDQKIWKTTRGVTLYTSETLDKIWGKGFTTIGDVTFESAAYVARYVTKKINGEKALEHYNEIDKTTGEIITERIPEFTNMSRRPGIGKTWFDKYKTEVYPSDFVIMRNQKIKPAKYYDTIYDKEAPEKLMKVKRKRRDKAKAKEQDNTWDRLDTKKKVHIQRNKLLKRGYENET